MDQSQSSMPLHNYTGDSTVHEPLYATSTTALSATKTHENPEDEAQRQSTNQSKAKGSHFYKANTYHMKLIKYAQELADVASVTLCMEIMVLCQINICILQNS